MLDRFRHHHLPLTRVAMTVASIALSCVAVSVADVPVASAACRVLTKIAPGDHNIGVPCLESRLNALGLTSIRKFDILYDPVDVRAVQRFQRQRGIFADGIVTSITSRELGLRGALPTAPGTARLTIIGDSTSAAMRWYDELRNDTTIYDIMGSRYDLVWSLESCRRLIVASCIGRVDPGTGEQWRPVSVLPLMQGSLRGRLGQGLVVMAGYDDTDIATAITKVMDEATAQGVPTVYWLTYRTSTSYGYGPYYRQHNAQLAAAAARYPNLVVLDWNGYTRSLPAATQTAWFAADNIHLNRAGALGLASWLRQRIAPTHIERCVAHNAGAGVAGAALGTPTVAPTAHTGLRPLEPTRVLDTRTPLLGGGRGALAAGRMLRLDLSARVPLGTQSVAVNITAVDPCTSGSITTFACGHRPALATIALAPLRTSASLAIAPLSKGYLCVFTSATTDVVVDLLGAFVPGGALFHPITPKRFFSTRPGIATVHRAGPVTAPGDITVRVAGNGGVPADASAAWFNVAAVNPTARGVLSLWPGACVRRRATSVVTFAAGRTTGNGVLVGLGGTGSVCLHLAAGSTDVALDLAGWFGGPSAGGLEFGQGAPHSITGGHTPSPVAAGVPFALPNRTIGVYGVTASTGAATGTVAARPCGTSTPAYLLTTRPHERVSNITALRPSASGWCIASTVATAVAVQLLATFTAPAPATSP